MIKKDNEFFQEEITFNRLNDVVMHISKIYIKWHNTQQDFGIKEKLYRSEIHTIQAIGNNPGINLTKLANLLGVTKPTMSQKINKLIGLNLVRKQSSSTNEKEVMMVLTDKGWAAHQKHEENHKKLFKLYRDYFGEETSEFSTEFEKNLLKFHQFLKKITLNKKMF